MENNECNANHLDADVLLPPRKRLLAGLKRQNSDVYSQTPSMSSCGGNDFDTRMNNLLKNHLSSSPNASNEKIVEASRTAAGEAAKVARAARVVADEKSAIAVKAVAAAKSALELVATMPDEPDEPPPAHQENYLKKNKMKKHVAVQSLYNKPKDTQSCRTDEELARKLHQVINSSPRISKNGSTSESKHPKLKKHRISPSEKTNINNGGPDFEIGRTSSITGVSAYHGDSSSNGVQEKYRARLDLNTSKFKKRNGLRFEDRDRPKISNSHSQVNRENGNAGRVLPEERYGEGDDGGIVRKRMKLKQKRLPLNICNVRDLESPKENQKSKNMSSAKDTSFEEATTLSSKPLFPVGPSSDTVGDGIDGERTSLWKCQALKSPASVIQNKVMQS